MPPEVSFGFCSPAQKPGDNSMKRILVVDDEEAIRLLYREELREAGYEVAVAADGSQALRMAQEARPDLMTIDIKMPGMDGIELLRQVREIYRDLPIIICTAYGDFKRDFGTWASDAYLTKSADLRELKEKIRDLLGKGSSDQKTSSE
jgi:CheY-like chemotaxis protein